MNRILRFIRPFKYILALTCLITGIASIWVLSTVILQNNEIDTINLTNVGFVMLIALSNACFSWSRSLNSTKELLIKNLNDAGVTSILGAISFLFGSLTKYLNSNLILFSSDYSLFNDQWVIVIFKLSHYLFIITATAITCDVIIKILMAWYWSKDRNYPNLYK